MVATESATHNLKNGRYTEIKGQGTCVRYDSELKPPRSSSARSLKLRVDVDDPSCTPIDGDFSAFIVGHLRKSKSSKYDAVLSTSAPDGFEVSPVNPERSPTITINGRVHKILNEDGQWLVILEVDAKAGELPWLVGCDILGYPQALYKLIDLNTILQCVGTYKTLGFNLDKKTPLITIRPSLVTPVTIRCNQPTFHPLSVPDISSEEASHVIVLDQSPTSSPVGPSRRAQKRGQPDTTTSPTGRPKKSRRD